MIRLRQLMSFVASVLWYLYYDCVLLTAELLVCCPSSFLSISVPASLDNGGSNAEAGLPASAVSIEPSTQTRRSKLVSALKVTVSIYYWHFVKSCTDKTTTNNWQPLKPAVRVTIRPASRCGTET